MKPVLSAFGPLPCRNKGVSGVCCFASNAWKQGVDMNEGIDVSGTYLLATLAAGFVFMVPLVWALVRFWLFAR